MIKLKYKMEFTCSCGNTSTCYNPDEINPKCRDCIDAEVKADEPRRRAKVIRLIKELESDKLLTHNEALLATTTPGSFGLKRTDVGSKYLSGLLNKSVPFCLNDMIIRIGDVCVVNSCVLNGYWPWARYKRDNGFGYICLIFEP